VRAFILTCNDNEYLVLADTPDSARRIANTEWPEHVDPSGWDKQCETFDTCQTREVGIGYARELGGSDAA
jgi:hypothetical protein